MNIADARKTVQDFYEISQPTESQAFAYVEALEFLLKETGEMKYAAELGGYYYELRRFDLALKYYEIAAEGGHHGAIVGLGYIWYYGRTGERDYEKAFHYYSLAAEQGDLVCEYKIADMYKNGYFVEKDYEKYKSIVEGLYPKVKNARNLGAPVPEIYTRLAHIRAEEGREREAVELYLKAKSFLAQRISYNAFFGNLNIMKWLIGDLYKLIDFDETDFDFFDLYYVLLTPCRVSFFYKGKKHEIRTEMEGEECVICFDGKWYRTVDDFFAKAGIDDEALTAHYDDFYAFMMEECHE